MQMLKSDDGLARQLFQSAYVGRAQEALLEEMCIRDRVYSNPLKIFVFFFNKVSKCILILLC